MANDTNQVTEIGRLTRDAELAYAKSGMAIAKFSLAVGEKYKDNEYTNYFNCVLFGKSAEALGSYLTKGKQICVVGKLKQDRWEKDGANRSSISIIVNSLQFLQNVKDESPKSSPEYRAKPTNRPVPPEDFEDEEIPY